MKNPSVKNMRAFFFRTRDDEAGAVALLCLAAVLALMMMAWVILDAHKSTSDKIMLQGAADTAAFSHAAVEARSMNMIAYANIAKRSIVGIHSLYPAMFFAYTLWLASHMARCFKWLPNLSSCAKFFANVFSPWGNELIRDHVKYSGNPLTPYLDASIQALRDIASWLGYDTDPTSMSGGNSKYAHAKDIKALDNYQHYMKDLTPWWGWSEQLSRGWRNGATAVASFPPPPGKITVTLSGVQKAIDTLNGILGALGMNQIDVNTFHGNDNLPVKKLGSYQIDDWVTNMLDPAYALEHTANTMLHRKESARGAKKWSVILGGSTVFFPTIGIPYSEAVFGKAAYPYAIDSGGSEDEWLKRTSNLTFAYLNHPERMDQDRNKYSVPSSEYSHSLGSISDLLYKSSGYWTMAKSEIVYNTDALYSSPDLWHPSWTARMRPVHLPHEFEDNDFTMFDAYSQAAPYLALSAQVGSIKGSGSATVSAILSSIQDLGVMAVQSASMGPSTAGGIAK